MSSLPGACSEGSCESCEYPPEEGVRVLPCNNEVDGGQHKKTMDGMSNDAAGYIFSQTGKQCANIIHLNDLASYKEHDTQRCIPVERQEVRGQNTAVDPYGSGTYFHIGFYSNPS